MKRYKGLMIALICAASILGIAIIGFVGTLIYAQFSITSYEPYETAQTDTLYLETYVTEIQVEQDDRSPVTFIGFEVFSKDTDKSIYKSEPVCRALDFKGINFAESSNDIIVKSGDVGNIHFKQTKENIWELAE